MEAEIFKSEAYELLEDIEVTLLNLRNEPTGADLVNRLFRAVHTIKGSGAMFGFDEVGAFAHEIETAIDCVRQGKITLDEELIILLLRARDHILIMIDAGGPEGGGSVRSESELLIEELRAAAHADKRQPSADLAATISVDLGPANGEPATLRQDKAPSLKILIVEDEFVSRYVLQELLSSYGISHIAVNGFEAVLAFRKALTENSPYDLICLDIMMPGMDGREVAKELRRLEAIMNTPRRAQILVTTAIQDQEVIRSLSQNSLCDAYLIKPLTIEVIKSNIEKLLS